MRTANAIEAQKASKSEAKSEPIPTIKTTRMPRGLGKKKRPIKHSRKGDPDFVANRGTGKYRPGENPNSLANLIKPWTPGNHPKSPGRPKNDMAAIIARAIFENNPEMVYQAMSKELAKGSAYAFEKLGERAFGKLKEQLQLSGTEEMVARLQAGRRRTGK